MTSVLVTWYMVSYFIFWNTLFGVNRNITLHCDGNHIFSAASSLCSIQLLYVIEFHINVPSLIWYCWFHNWKGIWPVRSSDPTIPVGLFECLKPGFLHCMLRACHSLLLAVWRRVVERGRVKCGQYWPADEEGIEQYGSFVVINSGADVEEHYSVTSLLLQNLEVGILKMASVLLRDHFLHYFFFLMWNLENVLETWVNRVIEDCVIQGGPKKPDHFWTLITLQRLAIERRVICQKFADFV